MIAACIAEMASAIPSSSGVYHWASVTAGAKYGKAVGFFAGWYVYGNHLLHLNSVGYMEFITNLQQVEFPWMALRNRVHYFHPRQPSHLHVWPHA